MISRAKLWAKLRNRKYRKAFASTQLKQGLPFQIKAMRKARDWSQQKLADRSGLPQGTISRAENLNYGDLTLNVVLKIANGFDVAFVGRFVPFSELTRWYTSLSDELHVPTFEEEDAERQEQTTVVKSERPTESAIAPGRKGTGGDSGTLLPVRLRLEMLPDLPSYESSQCLSSSL